MKVWMNVNGVYRQIDPKWQENQRLAALQAKEKMRGSKEQADLVLLAIASAMKAGTYGI